MRLIVCDTGPILHLQEARLLELLQKAGKVYIPKMVDMEISELYPQWRKHRPEWITIEPLLPDETETVENLFLQGCWVLERQLRLFLQKDLNQNGF